MRQAPKAWMWNTIQGHKAGSAAEASAEAKEAGGLREMQEMQGMRGMRRGLLPRT
ncbi:hypothetical protein NSS64_04050 [Paenibacillus sp. FSL H8-0122]|uniref:hypothetical protein n=1 Tax=unclassified Paenibacillus TaxID=185978 RepID=UPI0004AE6A5D|nr:hypothetical protein [Paenibacillus sp. FSL R7-277]